MAWNDPVFRMYCERGQDPAFWAEPFNAASNAGFLIAAGLIWMRSRPELRDARASDRATVLLLAALAAIIGIGSFLFHTFATRWALLADVVPIMIFMAVYLGVALRLFLGLSWRAMGGIVIGFILITMVASRIACPSSAISITQAAREPCLKGTMGYVPALAALLIVGMLVRNGHPAGRYLLAAAGIFLVSMTLRWMDRDVCAATLLLGKVRGTHALWHLLNAVTLYVLLSAALAEAKRRGAGPSAAAATTTAR